MWMFAACSFCMIMWYIGTSICLDSYMWNSHLAKRAWRGHGEPPTPWQWNSSCKADWNSFLKHLMKPASPQDMQFQNFRWNVPWSTRCYISVVCKRVYCWCDIVYYWYRFMLLGLIVWLLVTWLVLADNDFFLCAEILRLFVGWVLKVAKETKTLIFLLFLHML